jgi:hypothetical protein
VDLIGGASLASHQLRTSGDLAAADARGLVTPPHAGQRSSREQLGEATGIDAVVPELGVGDRPQVASVHDHHAAGTGGKDLGDLPSVSVRFQRDPVVRAKAVGKRLQTPSRVVFTRPIECVIPA